MNEMVKEMEDDRQMAFAMLGAVVMNLDMTVSPVELCQREMKARDKKRWPPSRVEFYLETARKYLDRKGDPKAMYTMGVELWDFDFKNDLMEGLQAEARKTRGA